jgi:hypothetical protein
MVEEQKILHVKIHHDFHREKIHRVIHHLVMILRENTLPHEEKMSMIYRLNQMNENANQDVSQLTHLL